MEKSPKHISIAIKLSTALLLVGAVAAVGIFYFSGNVYSDNLREQITKDIHTIAESKEGHILEFLEAQASRVVDFSSDGYIREKTVSIGKNHRSSDVRDLNEHLIKNKKSLSPLIFRINIFDLEGNVISSTGEDQLGQNKKHTMYFKKAIELAKLPYIDTSTLQSADNSDSSEKNIIVSNLLTDRSTHQPIGVIANYILLGELNEVLSGHRVADLRDKYQYEQSVNRSYHDIESYLMNNAGYFLTKSKYLDNEILTQKGSLRASSACINEKEDVHEVYTNYAGEKVLGVIHCLEFEQLVLAVEIPTSVAFKSIEKARGQLLQTTILISLSGVLITMILMWTLIRRILKIKDSVKAISRGKFMQFDTTGHDELSELAQDINVMSSELERREADLKKFQLATESASDQVVITDNKGIVLYANKATEKITGFSLKEIIGKKTGSRDLWGGQMPKAFYEKLWNTVLVKKKLFTGVFLNKRKNGEHYKAKSNIYPILDHRGRVEFLVAVERDVTTEENTKELRKEFISFLSHQFRTPLSQIKWAVAMLLGKKEGLSDNVVELLGMVNASNQNMINLINTLLRINEVENKKTEVKDSTVDLSKIIKEITKTLESNLNKKKVRIVHKVLPSCRGLKMDEVLLREVVYNLVDNAIQYSPSGSSILVNCQRDNAELSIEVSDQGVGIDTTDQAHIFDKYFTLRKGNTTGHGLGLYLVKLLMDSVKGKIMISSQKDHGTAIKLIIPIKKSK